MPSHRLWAFERGVLWALDLEERAPAMPASPYASAAPVICAEARPGADEAEAALARAMGLAEAGEIRRRFAAGSRCFVARGSDGHIAGYGWVSRGEERIGELERTLRMRPDEAYIWDCATLAPYRRRGVYTALLLAMADALGGAGVRRLWIGAARGNRPSLGGFARAGFQPVASVTFLRALGLRRFWVRAAPNAPAALVVEARRALLGEPVGAQRVASARR
jgi:GNAT superfamily N-acetyltransferase